jgi:acyl-CoA thioester hydrolase
MGTEDGWHESPLRVRYGEVDRMGVVYHGHFLAYFEDGRTELLRSLGATYRDMEDAGHLLMVVEAGVRYRRPAHYDDSLVVRTRLADVRPVRMRFEYEIRRDGDCLATGHTVLACTDPDGRPCRLPASLRALVADGTVAAAADRRKGRATADVQAEAGR